MYKICVFGGTTEGRELVEFLNAQPCEVTACVATEYGQALLPEAERLTVSARRLPADEIKALLTDRHFDLVIDATHPYAASITKSIAGRAALFMLPEFKPVVALTILAGVSFGAESGFLVGAMTMLCSNMLFGQGPWTPWQMFAMGLIGFLGGVCFHNGPLRQSRLSLAIFGAVCSVVIYGGIMNPSTALIWARTLDWKVLLSYYLTGIPWDLVRGAATALFLWFGAEPMLEKLERIQIKYGLMEHRENAER